MSSRSTVLRWALGFIMAVHLAVAAPPALSACPNNLAYPVLVGPYKSIAKDFCNFYLSYPKITTVTVKTTTTTTSPATKMTSVNTMGKREANPFWAPPPGSPPGYLPPLLVLFPAKVIKAACACLVTPTTTTISITVTATATATPTPQPTCDPDRAGSSQIDMATGFVNGSPSVITATNTDSFAACKSFCIDYRNNVLGGAPPEVPVNRSLGFTPATGRCTCYERYVCEYFTFDPAGDTIAGDNAGSGS